MKHDATVTIILIAIFVISQITGLFLVSKSMQPFSCEEENATCAPTYTTTTVGERPETEGAYSVIYLVVGVAIGTIILLLLAKFKQTNIWRIWFFLAVVIAVSVALGVILPLIIPWDGAFIIAWAVAILIAIWKLWKPNIIIYNLAEVLMYSGIAVLLAPIFEVKWVIILLIIISIYDAYAVWKSKHMVKMAKFITGTNAFAGLVIPYKIGKDKGNKGISMHLPDAQHQQQSLEKDATHKNAILGGGDITFPLIFGGAVLQDKVITLVSSGTPFAQAVWQGFGVSLFVALGATIAVAGLFFLAKKDTFYPAMPFISAGCLLGWAVTLIL
jgi:presenilin-like A22 family membrane protease